MRPEICLVVEWLRVKMDLRLPAFGDATKALEEV
jgi:hypothetical protein